MSPEELVNLISVVVKFSDSNDVEVLIISSPDFDLTGYGFVKLPNGDYSLSRDNINKFGAVAQAYFQNMSDSSKFESQKQTVIKDNKSKNGKRKSRK